MRFLLCSCSLKSERGRPYEGHRKRELAFGRTRAFLYQGVDRVRAPTVPIKSKVGAGDSMVAGIMTALKRGWKIPDAGRFGVAAGAEAVMTEGAELCRREDTERLYERIGNQ